MSTPDADAGKTTQKCTLTPMIVRIKNMMPTRMYVTGYDGSDIGNIPVPVTLDGNGVFTDVAKFDNGPHKWDWIYLGHDKDGHSLTVYFQQDSSGVLTTTIGTYKGRKEPPGPLDPKYATAQPLFLDGFGNFIMQFNLLSYLSSSEKK